MARSSDGVHRRRRPARCGCWPRSPPPRRRRWCSASGGEPGPRRHRPTTTTAWILVPPRSTPAAACAIVTGPPTSWGSRRIHGSRRRCRHPSWSRRRHGATVTSFTVIGRRHGPAGTEPPARGHPNAAASAGLWAEVCASGRAQSEEKPWLRRPRPALKRERRFSRATHDASSTSSASLK